MQGGTVFRFVTDGIQSALRQARAAAGNKDIGIGGGTGTVRQFLEARLIDEMRLALRPIFMGQGENLWQGLDMSALGYECAEQVVGERSVHLFVRRKVAVR
jgi:dihydrofolate reductase